MTTLGCKSTGLIAAVFAAALSLCAAPAWSEGTSTFFDRVSPLADHRPESRVGGLDPEAAQPEEGPDPNAGGAGPDIGPEEPPKPSILRTIFTDWKGEVRFGLELASGNNDRARFRGGFNINKKYDGHSTAMRADYIVARNNRGESENRLISEVLQDWDTGGSKFSAVFLRANGDIDRFQDYDYRVNLSGGGKYTFVQNDKTSLVARVGASVRREFGSPNDDYVPEGAFYLTFTHKFSSTQRISANIDYLPEIERISRYRVNFRGTWDIDIDPEAGLGLRFQVTNRYDARPSRRPERNDFDLNVLLFWKF